MKPDAVGCDTEADRKDFTFPAPAVLDPILAFAERVDRRRRHIRPVRLEGVLGIELARYGEEPTRLRDGVTVIPGDRIVLMHLRNERVRALATSGWQGPARAVARVDLRALADWTRSIPAAERPVAFRTLTLLGPLLRREDWEVRPRPRSVRARVDDWFMRWLLIRWSEDGQRRSSRAAGLRSVDAWLSCREFVRRYATPDTQPGPRADTSA